MYGINKKVKFFLFLWRILNILPIRHLNFTSQHNDGKCMKANYHTQNLSPKFLQPLPEENMSGG